MADPIVQRSFAGGEISPALYARADQVKYQTGLRTCKNFVVQKHGGLKNRPGTRYIATAKSASTATILLKFLAGDENLVIEAGDHYFRFHKNGARLGVSGVAAWSAVTAYVVGDLAADAGVNYYCILAHTNQQPPNATYWSPMPAGGVYEIPTPYAAASDLHLLQAVQSGYVMTLVHPDHGPKELTRISETNWTLTDVVTAPSIAAPANLAGVAGGAGTLTRKYTVTAAKAETYEESLESAIATVAAAAEPTEDAPIALTWDAVLGAVEYYVYCDAYQNNVRGFIGAAGSNSFKDVGFTPDHAVTAPVARSLFTTSSNYPQAVGLYQQRRLFANTDTDPEGIWGSRVGFHSNFAISSPLQDDDAITFRIAGHQLNPVRHLIGLKKLVVLSDTGEWVINGDGAGVLLPTAINPDQQGYVGASYVPPVVVGNAILYVQARKSTILDLQFNADVEGFGGRDLSIAAEHLFAGYTIKAIDFAQIPDSIVWAVRSDGVLLGLTYLPDQDVWGWHRHTTGASGIVEDVAVIPESDRDAVYLLVKRTIGGSAVRYIERLETFETGEDAFFVDSGLSYEGELENTFGGLDHLEGQVVAVVANGEVIFNGDPDHADAADFTVNGGEIVLDQYCEVVHIGLPIAYPDLEFLDMDIPGTSLRAHRKRLQSVSILVDESSAGFQVGPSTDQLIASRREAWEAADPATGLIEINLTSLFTDTGRMVIRQPDPLPLTILGVIPFIEVGG